MDNSKDIIFHEKGKHFSKENRYILQGILDVVRLLKSKISNRTLAAMFNCSHATIGNELRRGAHPHTGRYSAARAQRTYADSHSNSSKKSLYFISSDFIKYTVDKVLNEGLSLDACVGRAKEQQLFSDSHIVCTKTLYNYVDTGLLKLRNIDLPLKVRRRNRANKVRQNLKEFGRSIDERPEKILLRDEFGHWEIDTVIGTKRKSDEVVLSVIERQTRMYFAIKIGSKTADAVKEGLEKLKEHFGEKFDTVFKTITSDNGSEFAKLSELEKEFDTKVYFAHPYTSCERGSNERGNGLLRRFLPKGRRIDRYSAEEILRFADWCNDLPRKILGYKTPSELFEAKLDEIYAA